MALDSIPFYGAYVARKQQNEAEPMRQLGQLAQFATLQQHFAKQEAQRQAAAQEAEFRKAMSGLPPDASQDQIVRAVLPYVGPEAALRTQQNAANVNAQIDATRALREQTLLQQANSNNQIHEQRMLRLQTDQDRAAELARHNRESERLQEELLRLRADTTPAPSLSEIVDPADPKRMLRIDARAYRGGSLGSPGVLGISGKEPTAAKAEAQVDSGREGVSSLVVTLRDLYQQLHKGGGIVDPEAGTLPNVMAGVSASAPGQAVGRFVGTQNQSLRNQIAQQRPLLLQAIRSATGMTAKQMDSNVELKMYLSAATDPTLDIKANLAALDKLDELYGLGMKRPAAPGQPTPTPGGFPSVDAIEAELRRRRGK